MNETLVQQEAPQQEAPQTEQPVSEQPQGEQQDDNSWFWAEGVPGQGEAPEWMLRDKYKSVQDQAKSYKELLNHHNEKLKGFVGAPEDGYELGEGSEDDVLIGMLSEVGKKYGMNQDMFNELVEQYTNVYAQTEEQQQEASKARIQEEIKKLGDNADYRLKNIADFAKGNFDGDGAEELINMATTAKSVEILEQLIEKSKGGKVADPERVAPKMDNPMEKLREMQFATNENGQRLIEVDMEHRKKYNELARNIGKAS